MKTTTHYQVATGSGWLSADGWSGYYKRLSAQDRGELPKDDPIYGVEQCREHIKEVRNTTGEYAEYWKTAELHIEKVTTITETIE